MTFFTLWDFKIPFRSFNFFIVNQCFLSWLLGIKIFTQWILHNLVTHYHSWSSRQPLNGGRVGFFIISSILQMNGNEAEKGNGTCPAWTDSKTLAVLTSLTSHFLTLPTTSQVTHSWHPLFKGCGFSRAFLIIKMMSIFSSSKCSFKKYFWNNKIHSSQKQNVQLYGIVKHWVWGGGSCLVQKVYPLGWLQAALLWAPIRCHGLTLATRWGRPSRSWTIPYSSSFVTSALYIPRTH